MSDPGLRRGMSYRKPVPVYEPTPPPSPLPVPSPPSPLGDDLQLWQFTDQLLSVSPLHVHATLFNAPMRMNAKPCVG